MAGVIGSRHSARTPTVDPAAATFDTDALRIIARASRENDLRIAVGTTPGTLDVTLHIHATAPASSVLLVFGEPDRVLRAHCRAVPWALATILLATRDLTGLRPVCQFGWPPAGWLATRAPGALGIGGTPAQVRALLRRAEPDAAMRPVVRVSG